MNFLHCLVLKKMQCNLFLILKNIVVRNKDGKPGKMHLHVKGEAVAKVADIKADEHLELVNKDHVHCACF